MATSTTLQSIAAAQRAMQAQLDVATATNKELRNALIRANQRLDELAAVGASGSFVQEGAGAVVRSAQDKSRERLAINDFLPTGAPDDWRTALVGALAEAAAKGGGTIWFPRQLAAREIDNTGLGAIDVSNLSNVAMIGDADEVGQIDIVTTDGTSFLEWNSSGNSPTKWFMDGIYLNNLNSRPGVNDLGAGHVFDFVALGLAKSFTGPRFRVFQRNPDYSILIANVSGNGGFIIGEWRGEWEYGTPSQPATVPAIKILDEGGLLASIQIVPDRIHCHEARAPFLWISNSSVGGWGHTIVFDPKNIEQPRSGLVYCAGFKACRWGGPFEVFDVFTELDRDMFEFRDGPGGLSNDCTVFDQIVGHTGNLVGVADEFQTVTSITQVAGTATVEKVAHGYLSGDLVDVVNARESGYRLDSAPITVTDADHFDYAVDSGTASPATGATIKMRRTRRGATSITQVGGIATLTTPAAHDLVVGQVVSNLGWTQAGYNIRAVILSVPTTTTLTFAVDPGTVSPGTGPGTWARGAMDIALLGADKRPSFVGCGGTVNRELEIDLGSNPAAILPLTDRMVLYRKHANGFIAGVGTDIPTELPELRAGSIASPTDGAVPAPFGVKFGGNQEITDLRTAGPSLNFPSLAEGASAELTVTISGITTNWRCQAAPQSTLEAGLVWNSWVSAADTVRIRLSNIKPAGGGAVDPAERTWLVTAWRH